MAKAENKVFRYNIFDLCNLLTIDNAEFIQIKDNIVYTNEGITKITIPDFKQQNSYKLKIERIQKIY